MILNKKVSVKIKNDIISDAKIFKIEDFKETPEVIAEYYVCHNNPDYNGSISPDLLGYDYSWKFIEYSDNYFKLNKIKFSDDVKVYDVLLKEVKYSDELSSFITGEDIKLFELFEIKKGRFEEYNSIDIHNNLLVLHSSVLNKKIEIKIGRFLRALADENLDLINKNDNYLFKDLKVDNSYIEDISNRFIAFNNNQYIKFEIVKGEDILKGYTKDNFLNDKGSLNSSCMVNKLDFLELYTKNSNIELAILYYKDKVIARCLVWVLNDHKVHDRIYFSDDWGFNILKKNLLNKGISLLDTNKDYLIQLDTLPELYYPYLDNMKYLDPNNKILSNKRSNPTNFSILLRSQHGHCTII